MGQGAATNLRVNKAQTSVPTHLHLTHTFPHLHLLHTAPARSWLDGGGGQLPYFFAPATAFSHPSMLSSLSGSLSSPFRPDPGQPSTARALLLSLRKALCPCRGICRTPATHTYLLLKETACLFFIHKSSLRKVIFIVSNESRSTFGLRVACMSC